MSMGFERRGPLRRQSIAWLAVIAPHNADVWSRALAPLHEPGPSWAVLRLQRDGGEKARCSRRNPEL